MTNRNPAMCAPAPSAVQAGASARRRFVASRWLNTIALLPALVLAGTASAQSCGVGETPAAFAFTGSEQTITVPAGTSSAKVYLSGGQGGAGLSGTGTVGGSLFSPGGAGGLGGRVSGTLALTPGQTVSVFVGGQASQAVNAGGIGQGVNGIGGGATDIRLGGNAIGNRVAVAGGGGGGGNAGWSTVSAIPGGNGGAGGGGSGAAGATVPGGTGPFGGGGGSVGTGGSGGAGCGGFPAGAGNATSGNGGASSNFSGSFTGAGFGGGGGGGATVGAGGGGAGVGTTGCQQNWNGGGGGGAGGASAATGLTAVTSSSGVQAGNGAVLMCFASASYSFSGTASGQTGAVTLQLVGTSPASTQQVTVASGAASFSFPTALATGSNWTASVLSAPAGQTCSITPASGTNAAADVTNLALVCQTVVVSVAPTSLPAAAFGVAYSQTISASSANGGNAPYSFGLSAGALPAGLTLSSAGVVSGTPTAGGSFTFTVEATSTNGFSGTRAYTFDVTPAAQTITALTATPAAPVFASGATFALSATGGASGNAVVFASTTPTVCTVAGSTATVIAAGTCSITADQAGNANYSAAPQVSLNVAIGQATQAITAFVANPAAPVFTPGGSFAVSASGGASGNAVVFSSTTPGVCTAAGNTVTMVAAGNCTLAANQAGNANFTAAPQVLLNVAIGQATQLITNFSASPVAPVFTPGGSFVLSATGGASTSPVVFASTTPAVCTVSGSTVSTVSAGVCALTANQAADVSYTAAPQVSLNVTIGQATQVITGFSATPSAPVYSPGGSFTLSAAGGASTSPVVFASTTPAVCAVSGNLASIVAAGSCGLTANQAGDINYTAAPQVALTVAISAATPTLTWIGDLSRIMGQPAFDLPNPASPSAGAFTFASSNGSVATVAGRTVTLAGDGVTTLTVTQAASGSYLQTSRSITLTVSARPDPTLDPSVVGGLQAQIDASLRFATAQQSNVRDRLRQQRHNPANRSSNGLSLASVGAGGGSVSFAGQPDATTGASFLPAGWGLWSAGVITVGGRDPRGASNGTDFLSDGITLGADWRVNDRWLVGVAGGMGWDATALDDARSDIDGNQKSLSVYGLWHNGEHLFLDGMLGWGQLDFDITRWSSVAGAKAQANRDGDQTFGSLTLGYERIGASSSLTGYGRFDASRTRLDSYRESGLGIYDLSYGRQTVDMNSLAVGLEGSYVINTTSGQMRPYWMLEYRDALENTGDVSLNYVLSPVAQDYRLGLTGYGDNVLAYGAGLDVDVTVGWRLSLLFRREHASNYSANTSLGLLLTYSPRATSTTVADVAANGLPSADAAAATGNTGR